MMNQKVKSGKKSPGRARPTSESRQRIIDAAVKLFARHGYAGTGMRELAAEAGVNLAMINYFFGSKKGLLKELLDEFFAGYLEVTRKQLEGDRDALEKLDGFIQAAVAYFAGRRDHLVVVITELPHDDPEVIDHKAAWGRQMMRLLGKEICTPLSEQRDWPVTPLLLGPLLTSMMASRFLFAPISDRLKDGAPDTDTGDYARTLSRIIREGLMPR